MTRGVSIAVIIAMSLMSSFHGRSAAATGYFYEQPTRPYNPTALPTLRFPGHYDQGSKVVTSPRPRITVPPIPSLPPLTSLTTPKTKNTNRQPGSTADARPRPAAPVYPRPTVPAPQTQPQRSQFTRKTQPQPQSQSQSATKPSQFQQQPRPLFSQAPSNPQNFYQRQQSLRPAPASSAKTSPRPTPRPTFKTGPTSTNKPPSKPVTRTTPRVTSNPRLPSASSTTRFPAKAAPTTAQKQNPTATQRPAILPAPPLPKLPPASALTSRTVAQVTSTRPTAPPAISRRWSFQKPDEVTNSRPIQASSSSSLLQSPDIYVINGRQLKQYKVYEQIDNDIEQDLGSFAPANYYLHSYHARIGATHPLGEDLQVQSRFGNQRSQQLLQPPGLQSPTSIALGSGGLGFVKLPNGNVYLGSGSLGYISGLQRTLDVVQARTRTGAPAPDATHFGHGSLTDTLYYDSD